MASSSGRTNGPNTRRLDVLRHYVDTVTSNIEKILRGRPSMTVQVETIGVDFERFLNRVDAEGDRAAALGEWAVRHNASRPTRASEK